MAANLANEGIILHRIDFLNANPDCWVNIWDVLIEQCITAWLTVVGKQILLYDQPTQSSRWAVF